MSSHPTKETVGSAIAARSWRTAQNDLRVVGAEYHATLVELCRQQHEALVNAGDVLAASIEIPIVSKLAKRSVKESLALWPDDPTEDSHD